MLKKGKLFNFFNPLKVLTLVFKIENGIIAKERYLIYIDKFSCLNI